MAITWLFTFLISLATATCPSLSETQSKLQLSNGSSIGLGDSAPQRWSVYAEPKGNIVVNVASESDVSATVQYCNDRNLQFLVQNGGNGWADTFDLGNCGVIINIAGLNEITFNQPRDQVKIGGGVGVQAIIEAAWAHDTRVAVPTCNCLGWLGSSLGGGIDRMAGLYGWLVDQVGSMTVVTASGQLLSINATANPDLFWALNGAGPNFGIVTSVVLKAYPMSKQENIAWQGPVIYADDKLESLMTAINSLNMTSQMSVDLLLSTTGAPTFTPAIILYPFYLGNASDAEKAFAPLLDVGPIVNNATTVPYLNWSDWSTAFCSKGGSKPVYGVSGSRVDPVVAQEVYNEFKSFIATYGEAVGYTTILIERYSIETGLQIGNGSTSYPLRDLSYHTAIVPWYANSSLDEPANAWGAKTRDLMRTGSGLSNNRTYINFAHGDEPLIDLYGDSLPRLKKLKAKFDPQNRFNQWFPLG